MATLSHILNPSNNNYTECRIKASDVRTILSAEEFEKLIDKEEKEYKGGFSSEVCGICKKKFFEYRLRMRHQSKI
jgi:hypothetical protein